MKKKKKSEKEKLVDKCFDLWGLIIRSKGYCEKCGKSGPLNAHHFISRVNKNLRFDLRNGVCTCVGCHMYGPESAHLGSAYFDEWFRNYRPEDYAYLMDPKWRISKTWYIEDYQEIYIKLKEVINDVQ